MKTEVQDDINKQISAGLTLGHNLESDECAGQNLGQITIDHVTNELKVILVIHIYLRLLPAQ